MKLVIDIDEAHLYLIKYKVAQGNTEFYPYVIIANGKPFPKGHWKPTGEDFSPLECSECGYVQFKKTNFCPNCGAKMESEDNE